MSISKAITPRRVDVLDALRGTAMVWMTVYHFCFDLNAFAYWKQDFYLDPFWTWQRSAIVSLFLWCAGMGQALALAEGQSWSKFWRRWGQIVACAALVSVGSWWMYPNSYIYFGVLHGMAVMLLLVRGLAPSGRALWLVGVFAFAIQIVAPEAIKTWGMAELFNQKWLNWLGLITHKPITEDYVPVLPWLGVMCWGMASANWLQSQHPTWLTWRLPPLGGALARLGRWSLSYYMLHQPLLIGLLLLLGWARK